MAEIRLEDHELKSRVTKKLLWFLQKFFVH